MVVLNHAEQIVYTSQSHTPVGPKQLQSVSQPSASASVCADWLTTYPNRSLSFNQLDNSINPKLRERERSRERERERHMARMGRTQGIRVDDVVSILTLQLALIKDDYPLV